jgi:hypothetical protein
MTQQVGTEDETDVRLRAPVHLRLPGFINDDEIGLGDAIKRVTYMVGIGACGGCEQRAAMLNRWMIFTR